MPLKHKEIRKMVNRLGVSVLCLVETRVKQFNFDRSVSSMVLS
jgi:16S rRNA U516 pseudouridylate synthase RsuA-like enzyme